MLTTSMQHSRVSKPNHENITKAMIRPGTPTRDQAFHQPLKGEQKKKITAFTVTLHKQTCLPLFLHVWIDS